MKDEIVKYGNSINDTALKGLRSGGLDLFMTLCNLSMNKGVDVLSFDYPTIKNLTGLKGQKDEYVAIQYGRAVDIINGLRFAVYDEKTGKAKFVTLFPTCENDPDNKTITVRVNPDAKTLLNDIDKNFTKFELGQFVSLESKYSKNLFRLLKQYRQTGTYRVEAEKFRELMDCPKSYPNGEFMRVCVNVAVQELSRGYFKGLKVHPIKAQRRGAPIVAYEFTFQKSKEIPGQYNISDYAETSNLPDVKKKAGTVKASKTLHNYMERDQKSNADLYEQIARMDAQRIQTEDD